MTDFPIEWLASFIAITTSSFRAFNLGYQAESYFLSIFTYIIFIVYAEKKTQKVLNIFYILTAFIGAYRYGDDRRTMDMIEMVFKLSQEFALPLLVLSALILSLLLLHLFKYLVKNNTKKKRE